MLRGLYFDYSESEGCLGLRHFEILLFALFFVIGVIASTFLIAIELLLWKERADSWFDLITGQAVWKRLYGKGSSGLSEGGKIEYAHIVHLMNRFWVVILVVLGCLAVVLFLFEIL